MELHFPHLTNGIHAPVPRKRKISLEAPMILSLGVAATLAYFIL